MEDLATDDFLRSAEHSKEVKISQSTVTCLDPSQESGSGTISFAVGKQNVKVIRILEFSPVLFLQYFSKKVALLLS